MILDEDVRRNCRNFSFEPPAGQDEVHACELQVGHALPEQLSQLLLEANGGDGWIGGAFLSLYNVEFVSYLALLPEYRDALPGVLIFGSDGGEEYFGLSDSGVVMVSSDLDARRAVVVAGTIRELLMFEYLGDRLLRAVSRRGDTSD